jgi:hypothetical protein
MIEKPPPVELPKPVANGKHNGSGSHDVIRERPSRVGAPGGRRRILCYSSLGPILAAGPLVAWIIGALEGVVVVGGFSALGAGLYSIGIPKDSVVKYETALKSDKFLLLAHGTAAEVANARDILQTTHPLEVELHGAERGQLVGGSGR